MADEQAWAAIAEGMRRSAAVLPMERIPEIDLYMDQLTTFMEEKLRVCKRGADEKILTKTMINNYSKDKMLPPSVNKKYSREHMMRLVMIYHLKSVLSIQDIHTLLKAADGSNALAAVYQAFTTMQADVAERAAAAVPDAAADADKLLPEGTEQAKAVAAALRLSLEAAAMKRAAEMVLDGFLGEKK